MHLGDRIKENIFQASGNWGQCSIDETIVISGVPRAGTTWMLELLRLFPGYKALNEPLMFNEARQEYDFGWHKHIAPKAKATKQRRYLETVLTGRLGISPAWFFDADTRPAQLVEHATRKRMVVKFCRLNRMLHWFARQFDIRGIILMVRHPCAVVASMLRHGAWDEKLLHGMTRRQQALHGGSLPTALREQFLPILERIETRVEVLATHWCLDHYVPLVQHANNGDYPWTLVPYERLVTRGQLELDRIADALGTKVTDTMREHLSQPSSSVEDRVHQNAEQQLSKWRRRLSSQQVAAVMRVVEDAGLADLYTRDLEPDYEVLNHMQKTESKW